MSQQCWGVTAGKAKHSSSIVRGVTAGKMGRNSSNSNPGKPNIRALAADIVREIASQTVM